MKAKLLSDMKFNNRTYSKNLIYEVKIYKVDFRRDDPFTFCLDQNVFLFRKSGDSCNLIISPSLFKEWIRVKKLIIF